MAQSESSSPNRARPLRMRLLLLAASGLVPLLLVLAWGINYLVEQRQASAERMVLNLSRALATAIDAEHRSIIALLEQMGTSDELERADLRAFHSSARRTAEQLGWRQVVLADAEGNVLLRTNAPYGSRLATIDKHSLALAIASGKPVVGQIVEGQQTRSDTFAVRVPVIRGGKVVYVLGAVVPTDAINQVLTRQKVPTGSISSVFDRNSRRVARSVAVTSAPPSPSLKVILDRGDDEGVGRVVSPEGIDNFTGYTRLKDSGWAVVVGTSVLEANKDLYALLRAVAIGLAASMAFALFLAWLLARQVIGPIDALKDGAAALGRGDPVELPALDIVELDDVAVALANAASERDRAAAQVNDALRTAEEANRSKDQFLAVLGHELRNPLAPISNAVQLMALKGDESTAKERRIIERQLVHVTRLVDDLLDVSRITSGRLAITREPVDLGLLLRQVVDTIEPSVYQRTLSLELAPQMDSAWVMGDEVRLAQVFNNLLVNAIKFTSAGGSIRIRAERADNEARIDIEDNGLGISSEELDRIFDLFYQAPQSSDRAQGGLGLGLPIVRSLVEMHGGRVDAYSAGTGQGTCMRIVLPLCDVPSDSQLPAPAAFEPGAGNVMVVDDNEDAADTCATLLEMSGYNVRIAYTPEGALETLRQFTPQVAILDIGLPGMSGYQLARLMKDAPYNYPGRLVALTGYGQSSDIAASKEAGFDAHLTKPVTPRGLLDVVEKFSSSADTPS